MAKRFTQQEIEILSRNPQVKHIRENRLILTFEFRMKLWKQWSSGGSIRDTLESNGFDLAMIGAVYINRIIYNFKRDGCPSGAKNKMLGVNTHNIHNEEENVAELLSSGLFIKGRNGIAFHPDIIEELYDQYPNITIEEGLKAKGIDPELVGYQRIYLLKRIFNGDEHREAKQIFAQETIALLKNHPYIKRITPKQLVFHEEFYEEASHYKSHHINRILDIFEIDHCILSNSAKYRLTYRLRHWQSTLRSSIKSKNIARLCRIERNKQETLKESIDENFSQCKACIPYLTKQKRKELCQLIQQMPADTEKEYTIRSILCKIGISKTSYYDILKRENYGKAAQRQEEQDKEDIELIKQVVAYKGYPKGSRMITMMMPKLTKKKFSRGKIQRLMRKGTILCKTRKANNNKRGAQRMLETNVKDNVVKRQFRLERVGMCILTDVSYLKYGLNKTAYLSCFKDAASGKILGFAVSNRNDSVLVDDSLVDLAKLPIQTGAIIHSDQGVLYLSLHYQNKLKQMNLVQSMSRRGNCWDNASQESFFGHFKDECEYRNSETLKEVYKKINEYMEYYNQERPQWTRNKMTPNEFEEYLQQMDKEEFSSYQQKERTKYEEMMRQATEKAKKRAVDIGAS